jgi:acetyl-CoA carboxylase biotin carboxyl carrier protein
MNVRLLEQIVKLMAANDLNTVDVRDGEQRIILKRGPAGATVTYATAASAPVAAPPPSQPQAGAGASASGTGGPSGADENAGLVPIKAEMVGTFYASPKPGEKPFVNVGSDVDADTEVCLIEAMKNFFAVKAGVSGSIARVLVQDGQTVQFDQPLFLVRPR